ncbi:MAG: hypothetical protein AAFR27_08665 [Pseudomonadota bacterium]
MSVRIELDGLNRLLQSMAISKAVFKVPEIKEATADTLQLKSVVANLSSSAQAAGKSLAAAATDASDPWEGLRSVTGNVLTEVKSATNSLGQSIGGIFSGLKDQTLSFKDAALSALQSVLGYLNQMNLAKGGNGVFGGGFLQSLIGGFLNIPSFDGGGFTGAGPRAGGLDGKGGFAAILHPNETIVDHSRRSGSANSSSSGNVDVSVSVDAESYRVIVRDEAGRMIKESAGPIIQAASKEAVSAVGKRAAMDPAYAL